jgi:hypothetical protein
MLLKLKACSELLHTDMIGAEYEANIIALVEGIKVFTLYPVEDVRKRAFNFDAHKETKWNRIVTPYMDREGSVKVRWMPIDSYMIQGQNVIDNSNFLIACPKEFKFSHQSATWKRIKYAWSAKKDIVIIPPIERPEEEGNQTEEMV